MKSLFLVPIMTAFALLFIVVPAVAQQTKDENIDQKQRVMKMMRDTTMRSAIMKQIARNPQLRRQMLQRLQMAWKYNRGMRKKGMGYTAKDTSMQAHMQEHRLLMQLMREDREKLAWYLPDDPSARRKMMEWHIKCMESIQDPALRNRNKKIY